MSVPKDNTVIRSTMEDNVGIVTRIEGLNKGTVLEDGTCLIHRVPMGHKVALSTIGEGKEIIRYGQPIGFAGRTIKRGEWVQLQDISLPSTPDLQSIPLPSESQVAIDPLEGFSFQGYRNRDGTAGTRNILAVAASVQCVAGVVDAAVKRIKQELLPRYPNVDDVVGLNHSYGCGVAIEAPQAKIPIRTIRNLFSHPNFGGEAMVVGLGCEKLQQHHLVVQNPGRQLQEKDGGIPGYLILQDESFQGFDAMISGILKMAEVHLERLNGRKRETCPASDLVVGIQCGGSDVFSGITANPVAGYAADLVVRAGGSVMFSEVTEVRDAVHLLVPRAVNAGVARALLDEMQWYDDYLKQGQMDRSANTSPGNRQGGLSNIVEKSLGSIVKSGTTPIVDVIGPGEKIRRKGLTFAATPAGDFVCGTLQLAAGMNMHVFTTGRGTPYGMAEVPVIKVGSNTKISRRWFDLIDLDAGQVVSQDRSVEEMGWELFRLILEIASGNQQAACDRLGLHNDLVLFNPGPLT